MNGLTLLSKVALLLSGSLLIVAAGTYFGRAIQSIRAFILLAVLFIGGAIGVMFLARVPPVVGITSLFVWVFISGLFIGPSIEMYAKKLGWQTVFLVYAGTGGVMALTGAVGMFSGVHFSRLGPILMFGFINFLLYLLQFLAAASDKS